jgi:dolichol kinase
VSNPATSTESEATADGGLFPAEVERRLVHAGGAVVPAAWAVGLVEWRVVQFVTALGLVLATLLEIGRLSGLIDHAIYDRLTREYEQDNVAGYALYTVGMSIAAFGFEPAIAAPAMLMLAIADPVSGLLGSGELKAVKQTYVLLTTFSVATLLAIPFVPGVVAILGGVAATVADGMKPVVRGYVVDDNLTIPPAAAVAMWTGVALV